MLQRQSIPPIHDVDIRLLRVFKSVVECGGLSAAEMTLGVGRSAISKHLADLEFRLAVRLCERGRSGFSITPHGEAVYRATIELLDALEQFRAEISIVKGTLLGTISLCLMDNLHLEPGNPVALAIKRFSQRSKDVEINLSTAGSDEAEEAVSARVADLAITASNKELPGLTYLRLSKHCLAMYAATINEDVDHSIPTDPAALNVAMPAYLSRDHSLFGHGWHSTAVANDLESTIQLILTGRYAGLLPEHIAKRWVDIGEMATLPLEGTSFESPTYLVLRSKARTVPIIRALADDIVVSYRGGRGEKLLRSETTIKLPVC